LKALSKSVQNHRATLENIDHDLALATDDAAALELRVDLLRQTQSWGRLPARVLSILREAGHAKEQRVFGQFYLLSRLLSDADLDEILDGVSQVLRTESRKCFAQRSLFDEFFKRRLDIAVPITSSQLANWLQSLRIGRDRHPEKILAPLKSRFEKDPGLFKSVFELLADDMDIPARSFSFFLGVQLWKLLPATVWPVSQCDFFLSLAERSDNSERAADFFHAYISWFPSNGASVGLAEAGFDLLARRHDIAKALGKWNVCKIEKWRKDRRREKKSRKRLANRANIIEYLTPRLTTIRAGSEENALEWATAVCLGFSYDGEDVADLRERLITVTNEEITDALIEGIVHYAETPIVPQVDAVLASWRGHHIPHTHILLTLSVFLRVTAGLRVPKEALPACIAAVVTNLNLADSIPGWTDTLSRWLLHQARQNPFIVSAVLRQIWVATATIKYGNPGFMNSTTIPARNASLLRYQLTFLRRELMRIFTRLANSSQYSSFTITKPR
jgi:hypothetical protein